MPEGFPPLTLGIMRVLCALTILYPGEKGQEKLTKCLDALFAAFWVESRNTTEKDILAAELNGVLGPEDTGKGECSTFPT